MSIKKTPLGKNSDIPLKYDPSVLTPLSRLDSRTQAGLEEYTSQFEGRDYWTSYETSWLNEKGIPRNKILNLSYSSQSQFFIESKSLKLYLYSLNNKEFRSSEEVQAQIKEDLENSLKTEVIVELDNKPRKIEETFTSIDSEDLDKIDSHPLSLSIEPEEEADVTEELSTSLFRSLCPVTSQPDWATIYIRYKGNKINHKSLLKYLLSYRNHQGFHEECVERIFSDILQRIRIDELFVRANFLRRGGIEINPVRVTPGNSPEIIREIRQ